MDRVGISSRTARFFLGQGWRLFEQTGENRVIVWDPKVGFLAATSAQVVERLASLGFADGLSMRESLQLAAGQTND